MNVTNGSASVTAPHSDFTSAVCNGIASGTASIRAGSAALSVGAGNFVSGLYIVLTGTKNQATYTMRTDFVLNSSSSVTLGGLWPGDNGTVNWIITSDTNWSTIAKSNDEHQT